MGHRRGREPTRIDDWFAGEAGNGSQWRQRSSREWLLARFAIGLGLGLPLDWGSGSSCQRAAFSRLQFRSLDG